MTISYPKKSKRRRWWLWLGAAAALLLALGLNRSPSVAINVPATPSDALALRNVFERTRDLSRTSGGTPLRLSWPELNAAAALGGPALSLPHLQIDRAHHFLIINTSKPLPLGFWANASVMVKQGDAGGLEFRGRLGRIPLPAPVMHGLIWSVRQVLRARGVSVPPVDEVVRNLSVSDTGVSAELTLPPASGPRETGLMQALGRLRPDSIDAAAVSRHYCHLAALERKQPETDFAVHVRRAFAGNANDGRARLLALAMLTVSPKVGQLVGSTPAQVKGCTPVRAAALLNKRVDLAKHWALSAALSASLGADASLAMGQWKEMADSGDGGSGFSYADLAADRAGVVVAERLADPARAPAMRKWLANVTQTQLLPIQKLALAEGMSEGKFAAKYRALDSPQDKAMVARIDAALNAALP